MRPKLVAGENESGDVSGGHGDLRASLVLDSSISRMVVSSHKYVWLTVWQSTCGVK